MRRTVAKWFEARRLRKAIRAAKPVAIADLDEATLGRIEGKVAVLETELEAPLTGRRCVYYSYSVLEEVGPYARAGAIVTLHRETYGVPFLLENDGHRAVIDPTGATISARVDFEAVTLSTGPLDPRLAGVLARLDYNTSMTRPLIFLEGVLEVGESVTICAAGVREPDPDARLATGYRELARTRLRIRAAPSSPVIITDDPTTI